MINNKGKWQFIRQLGSRPPLTQSESTYWKNMFARLLKAGIELEYNLPDKNGNCHKTNLGCACKAVFKPEKPMAGTSKCHEQCARWNPDIPEHGGCAIAKEHGCAGSFCVHYTSPCGTCAKYDRGCNTCPDLYSPLKDPTNIRAELTRVLSPTKFVGDYGKKGVLNVVTDGSLKGDGGVEIITVGVRIQFESIRKMLSSIMEEANSRGAYSNDRCSTHIHLLAAYFSPEANPKSSDKQSAKILNRTITELEKPVPEIIFANFHQLFRRYHAAIAWMSSCGSEPSKFTRWEKFRKSILPYSPVTKKMPGVVKEVKAASDKGRYSFVNYSLLEFDQNHDISRFHVEGRYLDGCFSPSVVAAHACLLYASLLKAADLSVYGLLKSGDAEYMEEQSELFSALCNNNYGAEYGEVRSSDTRNLNVHKARLREQASELVNLVQGVLGKEAEAVKVLKKLAVTPVAELRIKGDSWEQIEEYYNPKRAVAAADVENNLRQLLSTVSIHSCENKEEWVSAAANAIAEDLGSPDNPELINNLATNVADFLKRENETGAVWWSQALGSYIAE